jgi:hypothetical protein
MLDDRFQFRTVWAIDERPTFLQFTRKPVGRICLFILAIGLLLPAWLGGLKSFPSTSFVGIVAAAGYAHLPKYRSLILFFATWIIAFITLPSTLFVYGSTVAFMLFAWISLRFVRAHRQNFYSRRPVVTLLCVCFVLSLLGGQIPAGRGADFAWDFLFIFKEYIWFLAFAIVDQRSKSTSPDIFQMGILKPFWGSSNVPYGKGAAFLRKHWSKTSEELLVTQIKGLKLLAWSVVLSILQYALIQLFSHRIGIPSVDSAISAVLSEKPFPTWAGWGAIVLDTTVAALSLAAGGHKIIGIARLAGFRLPRNTCRPMQSRTLAEFWNRYYFYFKELLVDFFYIPTFLGIFKQHPRLRHFFATFMAAGVGNAIYHFVRDIHFVKELGPLQAVESYAGYIFYCTVLAIGIGISQLRMLAGIKPSSTFMGRIYSFATVWSFIVCIHVFGTDSHDHTLFEKLIFMSSLFGVY